MQYILTKTTFTGVTKDNRTITMSNDNPNWDDLYESILDKDWDEVEELCSLSLTVERYGKGKVAVVNGVVQFKGEAIHNTLTLRILEMMREGFDIDPMCSFLENMMGNPSRRSIRDLYRFMEHNSLPITEDGCFLAYKKVNSNFTDVYTGRNDNSVGSIVQMDRRDVEDDPDTTCSSGLHFCSIEYLSQFGGDKIVILKINPADVVSIPTDYNNAKGRCCYYKVVGVHNDGYNDTLSNTVVNIDF